MAISPIPSLSGFESVMDKFLTAHALHGDLESNVGKPDASTNYESSQQQPPLVTGLNALDLTQDINKVLKDKPVLESQRGATVLEHAEAVIEHQRDRINKLEHALEKFNSSIQQTNDLYKQELSKYEVDNKDVRKQMQNLLAEYESLSRHYQLDKRQYQAIKQQLAASDAELVKYKSQVEVLTQQNNRLPVENEQLRQDNLHLINQVQRLQRQLSGIDILAQAASTSNANPGSGQSAIPTDPNVCNVTNLETRAMGKCLVEIENDLTTFKRLAQTQKMEIKRLHDVIAEFKKQRDLGHLGRPEAYLQCAQEQVLQMRKVLVKVMSRLEDYDGEDKEKAAEYECTYQYGQGGLSRRRGRGRGKGPGAVDIGSLQYNADDEMKNRSVYTALHLKASAEQRAMYDDLLKIVEKTMGQRRSYARDALFSVNVMFKGPKTRHEVDIEAHVFADELVLMDPQEGTIIERFTRVDQLDVSSNEEKLKFLLQRNGTYFTLIADTAEAYRRLACGLAYSGLISTPPTTLVRSRQVTRPIYLPPDSILVLVASGYTESWPLAEALPQDGSIQAPLVLGDAQEVILLADVTNNDLSFCDMDSKQPPLSLKCEFSTVDVLMIDEMAQLPNVTFASGKMQPEDFFNQNLVCLASNPEGKGHHIFYIKAVQAFEESRLFTIFETLDFRRTTSTPALASGISSFSQARDSRSTSGGTRMVPAKVKPPKKKWNKVYEFVGDDLHLYMNNKTEPIVVDNIQGSFKVDVDKHAISIICKQGENKETYVLSFQEDGAADAFATQLIIHNFRNETFDEISAEQICIVTQGKMSLYKSSNEAPILEFVADDTQVSVDNVKREICVMQQQRDKPIKMTLDCSNPLEFNRWKFALEFGGFLKTPSAGWQTYNALKEFRFAIRIFGDSTVGRPAFVIEKGEMFLYSNPTSDRPILAFNKMEVDVDIFQDERRLRVYLNHNTKQEQRFDFMVHLLSDFNNLCDSLRKYKYCLGPTKSKSNKYTKIYFVLSLPGKITIHKSKYDADPYKTIRTEAYNCEAKVDGYTITFTPKVPDVDPVFLKFKRELPFKKWILSLKTSGFIPLAKDITSKLYFPTIHYGHLCPELSGLI